MKLLPLTLLLMWAAPARADVAVPQARTWRDGCAARIDEAARMIGLKPGARTSVIPLRREDGSPNPVQYVEYATVELKVTAGEDAERRPDEKWAVTAGGLLGRFQWFKRLHGRFGKIEASNRYAPPFKTALDDCLKMGEPK